MTKKNKIMKYLSESKRILRLARKPTKQEYIVIAKITGAGMLIIGLLGMLISILFNFIGIR